jgi:hypothetical protein
VTTPYREPLSYPEARSELWKTLVHAETQLTKRFSVMASVAFKDGTGYLVFTQVMNKPWGLHVTNLRNETHPLLDVPHHSAKAAEVLPALIAALLAVEKSFVHTLTELNETVRDALATLQVVDGRRG